LGIEWRIKLPRWEAGIERVEAGTERVEAGTEGWKQDERALMGKLKNLLGVE